MPPALLLRRLLLLPLLAPLLAVLLVGAINPKPWVGLRLLIWRTPEWTIGSWLALAAGGGGALSATATALALQAGGASNRRQLHRPMPDGRSRRAWPWGRGEGPADGPAEAWVDGTGPEPAAAWGRDSREGAGAPWPAQASAGPSRHPAEPPPTLSVPFRVIRRGTAPPQARPGPPPGATTGVKPGPRGGQSQGPAPGGAYGPWETGARPSQGRPTKAPVPQTRQRLIAAGNRTPMGIGENQPLATGNDPEGRQRCRLEARPLA